MFIRFPTGLYSSVLPRLPADGGSVTYLISTTDPPRTNLLFSKLPPGVERRPQPLRLIDDQTRRRALDTLIFTISKTSRALAGSALREFEIGELLEFPAPPEELAETFGPGVTTEIRHDTGLLDYERLGIDDSQQTFVENTGESVFKQIQEEMSQQRMAYNALQVEIAENQKLTVESEKALAALQAMNSDDLQIIAMIEHLRIVREELLNNRGTMVNQSAALIRSIDVLQGRLLAVAQVVR